jgi:SAM-dependent methyltransferase
MTQENYHKSHHAVASSLFSELESTLESEAKFLAEFIDTNKSRVILDAGCGDGSSLIKLRNYNPKKLYVGIGNDQESLQLAKNKIEDKSGIFFDTGDFLDIHYPDKTFDFVYSTNNTIGTIRKDDRKKFVAEMFRVLRREGYLAISTWKRDKDTTKFLNNYLPIINFKIFEMDDDRISTDKGVFGRISLTLGIADLLPNKNKRDYMIQPIASHDSGLYDMILYRKI